MGVSGWWIVLLRLPSPALACAILVVNWRSVTATFAEVPLLVRLVSDGRAVAAGDLRRSATLCN
jgi:hypothetical protein